MLEPLHLLDWLFIGAYFCITLGIGLYFSRRIKEGGTLTDYFVAGRKMTWWLAGTSIVATSFAADTPLVIAGWMRKIGLQQNWFWWGGIMGMMLCTFFYARLWRRARIITDVEFVELRYTGKPAAILRGFHASYRALIQNTLVLAWVTLAATKIMEVVLDLPTLLIFKNLNFKLIASGSNVVEWLTANGIDPQTLLLSVDEKLFGVILCVVTTVSYCTFSGLWGVVATDFFQFFCAMFGCVVLAIIVLLEAGGPGQMVELAKEAVNSGVVNNGITANGPIPVVNANSIFSFVPPHFSTEGGLLAIWAFVVFIGLQWWAGGEGGGFLAQRLFSCKDEKHSVAAMLWFNLANYVLRPWPWIIVGIGSLFLIPDVTQYGAHYGEEYAYVIMLMKYLPVGFKGIMVASLMAAYMSTVSTHVNFGASYLINDLYKRFIIRKATQRHYVHISQLAVIFLTILAGVFAYYMNSIAGGWLIFFELMSGTGFVVLLRWYWWRVSPWSEIAAMGSSLLMYALLNISSISIPFTGIEIPMLGGFFGAGNPELSQQLYPVRFTINLLLSTAIWITVTFLTKPVNEAHLIKFYKRVRPAGWWKDIAIKAGNPDHLHVGTPEWIGWATGVLALFSMIFSVGKLCFGMYLQSAVYAVIATIFTVVMFKMLSLMDWSSMPNFAKEVEENED
ncbi:MAG: sodium:solute symporter family protein [Candidatus Auribacterota bacterium]|jgi:Na+/proline symporter|nr:sodium:solute symporter family protein [Candidatus Auribacterota bacterium]